MAKISSFILKKEIDKLMGQIEVLRKFHGNHSYFIGWRKDVEIFLYVAFGKESESLKKFCKLHYFPGKSGHDEKAAYNKGLDMAFEILDSERRKLPDKVSEGVEGKPLKKKKKDNRRNVITTLIIIILLIIYILLAYGRMIG